MSLIANCLETRNTLFQRQVIEIGDASLNGIVEPLQPRLGLGRAFVQFRDVLEAARVTFLPAIEEGGSSRRSDAVVDRKAAPQPSELMAPVNSFRGNILRL